MIFGPRIGGITGEMPSTWQGGDVVRSDDPVLGFRAWRAMNVSGHSFLLPLYSDYPPWPHYERMVASCPHWLKDNPPEDVRLRALAAPGQFNQSLRSRTVAASYLTHPRYLKHPADEVPPFHGCSCGLYFVDRMEQIKNAPSTLYGSTLQGAKGLQEGTQAAVVGSARLWGRMIRHEHGWRAQYAYPERLFILKPDNSPDPVTSVHEDEIEERRRVNLLNWRDSIALAYGVPVGFCERKDYEFLGQAISD